MKVDKCYHREGKVQEEDAFLDLMNAQSKEAS